MKKKVCIGITATVVLIVTLIVGVVIGASSNQSPDYKHLHDFGDWETVEYPTVSKEGERVRYCECKEIQIEKIAKLIPSENLEFALTQDGKGYTITGIGNCGDEDIILPEVYNGLPVVSISESAFKKCYSMKSIVLSNSITIIGNAAFRECVSLKNITIPNAVIAIGSCAFDECNSLENITVPNSITDIDDGVFQFCDSLSSVIIPDSVTSIGNTAFAYCSSLKSVIIPKSVTNIEGMAFFDCKSLISIIFEGTVEEWNAIEFARVWYHGIPATEVICSDGTVSLK